MKAKNLMVPLREHLQASMTIAQAALLFRLGHRGEQRQGVKALPVLDDQGLLEGILAVGDILRALYPARVRLEEAQALGWEETMAAFAEISGIKTVAELMTREVIFVSEETPLMDCLGLMLRDRIKRLPVVDAGGRPVGMLYERDLFYFLYQFFL